MSTLSDGAKCVECLEDGRCLPTCFTQGSGAFIATGLTKADARLVVMATVVPPTNAPGVAIVVVSGAQHPTVVNVLPASAARHLAHFINEKADEAER